MPYIKQRKFLNPRMSLIRDRWSQPLGVRPRLPSPDYSVGVYDDAEGEEELERDVLSDPEEGHIYQSVERQGRSPVNNRIYAVPIKTVQYSQYSLVFMLIM